ncbi:MAG: hypothetical protein WC532_00745 [Candidatus Omnitrophota bacterium]
MGIYSIVKEYWVGEKTQHKYLRKLHSALKAIISHLSLLNTDTYINKQKINKFEQKLEKITEEIENNIAEYPEYILKELELWRGQKDVFLNYLSESIDGFIMKRLDPSMLSRFKLQTETLNLKIYARLGNSQTREKIIYFILLILVTLFFLAKLIPNNAESRPYVEVEIVSPILKPDEDGITRLRYRLKNNEDIAVYDIRKGHRIFNEKNKCLKHYYDFSEQYLLDLAPGAKSLIHPDRLEKPIVEGKELDNKFLKLQLIITYKKSKNKNDKLYYSLENYILVPINFKEGYSNEFLVTKPSSRFGVIKKFIDECKEFK